jgi:glycerol-3-phosphate dehydrogenase (NAD(P)+)
LLSRLYNSSVANDRAAVLGTGSWGTALAVHLGTAGHRVALWGRDESLVQALGQHRTNHPYLPGILLPDTVHPTSSIAEAVDGARFVVVAVPSHGLRAVIRGVSALLAPGTVVVSATKGLETDSLMRMSEVLAAEVPAGCPVVVLSGPSFASEVARQSPTALVAASTDAAAVAAVQEEFRASYFRLYASDDVVGVEVGGALKNVIAIAAGVVEALNLGHNAMAALVTRGLAEISRLACAMGGRRETMAGLSGLGDLVLTCTGSLSRNHHVGLELGRGRSVEEITGSMRMIAEGINTTNAALALGERYGVEMPIAAQMADVLAGRRTPHEALGCLMLRPQKVETERN